MQKSARANRPTRAACFFVDRVICVVFVAGAVVLGGTGSLGVVLPGAATDKASASHTRRSANRHGAHSSMSTARGPRAAACGPCVCVSPVVSPAGLVVGDSTEWHIAPEGKDLVP